MNTSFYCLLVRLDKGIEPRSTDYEADVLITIDHALLSIKH